MPQFYVAAIAGNRTLTTALMRAGVQVQGPEVSVGGAA